MLTTDQQLALAEVRRAMCDRLKTFCFTDEMLRDKSIQQLLTLLHLMVGHRGYIGGHFPTYAVLEEIFGADAIWKKLEPEVASAEEPSAVVN